MPEFYFKGKEFVYNHHLTVPYRPLVAHPERSVGETEDAENVVIHGDNLHALKALLPLYAGKVDLVFIDPPYNTGKESWSYNDNVNSPMMKEWLALNPVNKDDMLRHDKWACMMYPRLKLLHELLSEYGSLWMTLDDNEVHRARGILDEIFGEDNFVANIIWQKMDSPSRNNEDRAISAYHDHLLVYAKDQSLLSLEQEQRENILDAYPLTLPNGKKARRRQLRKNGKNARRKDRETMWYPLTDPAGEEVWPINPEEGWEGRWVLKKAEWERREAAGLTTWIKREYGWVPYYIETAPDEPSAPWSTIWTDVDQNRQAKAELSAIFGRDVDFETPKPTSLIRRILEIAAPTDALVLDSFAGSGTTGHAVMAQNKEDDGDRLFILVEGEDYADRLTAERIRRVINGYEFRGKQREELFREKVTFTKLKSAEKLLDKAEAAKNLEEHNFDTIKREVQGGDLVVIGEKEVTGRAEGIGGSFRFYTLGEPLDLDRMLTGESLPDYRTLGSWLYHTATGEALSPASIDEERWYLGESSAYTVWLIYRPDLGFLRSREAALTLEMAERISETQRGKKHLVFAPSKFAPNTMLLPLGVEYAPLPFSLYRVERG